MILRDLIDTALAETAYAAIVTCVALGGLWVSNLAYDRNVPHYLSRKIGHSAGGLAFLIGVYLFSSAWWPIILSAIFSFLLFLARIVRPETFRGVGGSGRSEKAFSEIWFALIAIPVFGILWLWLDRPLLALSCLLFMAWGDCITGVVRSQVYHRPVKGLWGSLAMFVVCSTIAWVLIRPLWIGLAASVTAVAAEWAFGDTSICKWADDNWGVPLAALCTILIIMSLTGNL